ncbi:dynamin family protein [Exiguobacterium sp. s149]|uniref:dynamin family protein n=1 Tax=Exiguobacterium TaxID=33986 RepID=UPI001BE67383|nr:dynamin family protein [Exiguobacterium sp. s149]
MRKEFNEQLETISQLFKEAHQTAEEALGLFPDYQEIKEWIELLQQQQQQFLRQRFEIVVVGEFSTGKSTFINALLQKEVLPSRVTPTTATINFIRHLTEGPGNECAVVHYYDGKEEEVSFDQLDQYVTEMSKLLDVSNAIRHVDLFIDSPYLQNGVVLVDTPGLQALNPEHERITKDKIRTSQASILLFNMEQPGKRTEFEFLKDLSDSIDRIFFVANRLDGIPKNEIEEVVQSLETALRQNDYCQISRANVYPVSALQALKAHDTNVEPDKYADWSIEDLRTASRFETFEEKLESYLFDGEQTRDALQSPFFDLEQYYKRMGGLLTKIENVLNQSVDVEEMAKQFELLKLRYDVRQTELSQQVRDIKKKFDQSIEVSVDRLNSQALHLEEELIETLNNLEWLGDLEDVEEDMEDYSNQLEQLFNQSLQKLTQTLKRDMSEYVEQFDLQFTEEVAISSMPVSLKVKHQQVDEHVTSQIELEDIEQKLAGMDEAYQQLIELRKVKGTKHEKKIQYDMERNLLEQELKYNAELLGQNPARIGKTIIRERVILSDKVHTVMVDNPEYKRLVEQQAELRKALRELTSRHHDKTDGLIEVDSRFDSMEEWRKAKEELEKEKKKIRFEQIKAQNEADKKMLMKEIRRFIKQVKSNGRRQRAEFETFFEECDTLKIAKQEIDLHLEAQDHLLASLREEQTAMENLMKESSEEKKRIHHQLSRVSTTLNEAKERLQECKLNVLLP